MTTKYSEKDIERYAGLAGIRKRPTRFIGSNDSNGLFTCVREPLDNCCDLALAGINDTAHLVIDGESYWVLDNGPGIPVGKKEFADERGRVESLSVLFVVTGLTNAGKNFNSDTISRGAHGEGLKCTNAMSKNFKVWTFRDGKWWTIEYRDAKLFKDVGVGSAPKLPHGLKASKGTVIQFTPDLSLFARGTRLSMTDVRSWCELTSVLIPGFTVKFTNAKGVTRVMRSKDGVKEYLTKRVTELKCNLLRDRIFHISDKVVDVALGFSDTDKASIDCYTNGLRNNDGGEHLRAVYAALEKSLLPYRGKNKYTPTALRDGLLGLVNAKLSTPKFNNQTKDKLLDERGYDLVLPAVLKAFEEFWRKNKSLAAEICQRAAKLHQATYDFQQNKKLMQALKPSKNTKMLLPGKLTASPKCPPHKRELFLVEGDSAGGTAKFARYREYQEIYYLRGKFINAMRASDNAVLSSEEVKGVLQAIGFDPSQKDPINKLRVGRIIWLSDPDDDGYHINTLGLTLLYKYLPRLFELGKVFMVAASEYVATVNGRTIYGNSVEALAKQNGGKTPKDTMHLKGWGEASVEQLRQLAMDPATRRLYRVDPPVDGGKVVTLIMSDDPVYRKKMLGV